MEKLDPDLIQSRLESELIGSKVVVFNSTSSSNDVAWEYAKSKANNGLAVFAETQTSGRGRAGNRWFDSAGQSILCSVILSGTDLGHELLTLLSAVATAEAIGRCGGNEAKIKWPNDIFLNDKKIAGLLVESKNIKGRIVYVIGIGVNCHQRKDSFPAELQSPATSVDIETGSVCDRISLAKRLLVSIDDWLIIANKNAPLVAERWSNLSRQLGQRVTLVCNNHRYSGHCLGIDPTEGLILQLDTGAVRMFDAAHTRIVRLV